MKYLKLFSIIWILFLFENLALSQVRPGIKFGVSTPQISPQDIIVTDEQGIEQYRISVDSKRYGVHAGIFIQMQLGAFFLQPELTYNSSSIEYDLDSLQKGGATNHFRETYSQLDFPFLLGLKAGSFRIGGGPVGHIFIDNSGGFVDYQPDFRAVPESLTWGWQAGLGLDFWKLHIDLRYEGNDAELGDYITFFGKEYDFNTRNNRILASLGFSF